MEQEIKEKEDKPVPVEAKPYKVLSAEDKMKHFKTIMDGIVTEALQRNNVQLENTMISQVTDVVIQELGKVEERQEGQCRGNPGRFQTGSDLSGSGAAFSRRKQSFPSCDCSLSKL